MITPGPWSWWQEGNKVGTVEPDSGYFHDSTGSVALDQYRGGQESVRLVGSMEGGRSEYVPTDCILSVDYKPNTDNARLIRSAPELLAAVRTAIRSARDHNGQLDANAIRELETAYKAAADAIEEG
jgi:hypothetical protein